MKSLKGLIWPQEDITEEIWRFKKEVGVKRDKNKGSWESKGGTTLKGLAMIPPEGGFSCVREAVSTLG